MKADEGRYGKERERKRYEESREDGDMKRAEAREERGRSEGGATKEDEGGNRSRCA